MACSNQYNRKCGSCGSRKCGSTHCRNFIAYREYCILYRSGLRLPPDYFITLIGPVRWSGESARKIINSFFRSLKKAIGRGKYLYKYVWLDVQVKGRWPHYHCLVRTDGVLDNQLVSRLWQEALAGLWCYDSDGSSDCQKIYDWVEMVRYCVKGNQRNIGRVKNWNGETYWCDRKYLVSSKVALWRDDYYRSGREELERVSQVEPLEALFPDEPVNLVSDDVKASSRKEGRRFHSVYIRVTGYGLELPVIDSSFVGALGRKSNESLTILRYSHWPMAPVIALIYKE